MNQKKKLLLVAVEVERQGEIGGSVEPGIEKAGRLKTWSGFPVWIALVHAGHLAKGARLRGGFGVIICAEELLA